MSDHPRDILWDLPNGQLSLLSGRIIKMYFLRPSIADLQKKCPFEYFVVIVGGQASYENLLLFWWHAPSPEISLLRACKVTLHNQTIPTLHHKQFCNTPLGMKHSTKDSNREYICSFVKDIWINLYTVLVDFMPEGGNIYILILCW